VSEQKTFVSRSNFSFCDGIDETLLPAPNIEQATDRYGIEIPLTEPNELPPMQTYANMPSINGYRF
jgi:hypothetical protein